jgi:hypothetical protein
MFVVEVHAAVRHFVFIEGNSRREAARVFGLSRETVMKICRFSLPPGYQNEACDEAEAWRPVAGDRISRMRSDRGLAVTTLSQRAHFSDHRTCNSRTTRLISPQVEIDGSVGIRLLDLLDYLDPTEARLAALVPRERV